MKLDGPGLATVQQVALLRDQEIQIKFVSYLDIALVSGFLAIVRSRTRGCGALVGVVASVATSSVSGL